MFKKNIRIALTVFSLFTIKDLIFNDTIQWTDNTLISIMVFLIYALLDWANKPYEWNKKKKNNA